MSYYQQSASAPTGEYQQPHQQSYQDRAYQNQAYGAPQSYGYGQHPQQQQQYNSPPHHQVAYTSPPPLPARPGAQSQPPPIPPRAPPAQPPPIPPRHQAQPDAGPEQRRLPAPPIQSGYQPGYQPLTASGAPSSGGPPPGSYYNSPPAPSYYGVGAGQQYSPQSPPLTSPPAVSGPAPPAGSYYPQSPPSASYYGAQSPPSASYYVPSSPPAGSPPAVSSPPISVVSPPATSPPISASPPATTPGPDMSSLSSSFAQLGVGATPTPTAGPPPDSRAAQGYTQNSYNPPAQGYTTGYHPPPQAAFPRLSDSDDYAPHPAPAISPDGPTPAVLHSCPGSTPLHFRTTWYTLQGTDWTMCTACFEQFVAGRGFAGEFTSAETTSGECAFGLKRPRARRLLRDAQSTGDLSPLKAYAAKRATIKECRNATGVIPADGIAFFRARGVDGFFACGQCYEDVVLARPAFAGYWEPATQEEGDTWACDMWLDGPQEMYLRLGPGGWAQWAAIAGRRMHLPPCEGAEQSGGTVYTTRRAVEGLCICETCFVDHFAGRQFEHEFVSASVTQWTCDMHGVLLRVAAAGAMERGDFQILWNAMARYGEAHKRDAQRAALKDQGGPYHLGPKPGEFYTLAGPPVNFDVCDKCKACVVDSLAPGLAAGFVARANAPADTVCDICAPTAQRGMQYVTRLLETLFAQRFSHFAGYVRKFVDIPLCPRRETVKDGVWFSFGQGVLSICPDCWESYASRTRLAVKVPFRAVRVDGEELCSLFSPRMRKKWEETAAADARGDTGALPALLDFSKARSHTYAETYCTAKYLLEMQKIKLQSALHAGTMSAVYNGMNYSAIQSGTADAYKYNGRIYESRYGVIADQLHHSSQQGVADANDGNVWFKCAELERRWAEVE